MTNSLMIAIYKDIRIIRMDLNPQFDAFLVCVSNLYDMNYVFLFAFVGPLKHYCTSTSTCRECLLAAFMIMVDLMIFLKKVNYSSYLISFANYFSSI